MGIVVFLIQRTERNYVYVDHEGGYTALGYIYKQELYTDAEIIFEDEIQASDISEVRQLLQSLPIESTLSNGVQLNADAGIKWVGTATNFKLANHRLELKSNGSAVPIDWLNKLEEMEENNLANYESIATLALRYEKPPGGSFFISRLLSALDEYL